MSYDVILAGLGAMGSATAYHLAGTHQKVLGLDRYRPPHTLGSSHGGSRIIRETSFEHPRYVPLARRAYDCWREIERQSGVSLLQITGGLFAGPATGLVGRTRESAVTHGVVHEMLSAGEMQRRWPGFHPDAEMVGLYEAGAGVLDPERCIATCLDGARRSAGIDLRLDEPLERWEPDGAGVVVTTPRGRYRAGKLVLALGPWMLEVVGPLGVALSVERVVQHWFATRDAARVPAPVHLWEYGNGEVFYGFTAAGPPRWILSIAPLPRRKSRLPGGRWSGFSGMTAGTTGTTGGRRCASTPTRPAATS